MKADGTLSPLLVLIMAAATGLAVACNYYAQPLLPTIGMAFGVSAAQCGLIVTCAQVGYGLGLLLIVPLGDLMERRGLVVGQAISNLGRQQNAIDETPAEFLVGGRNARHFDDVDAGAQNHSDLRFTIYDLRASKLATGNSRNGGPRSERFSQNADERRWTQIKSREETGCDPR